MINHQSPYGQIIRIDTNDYYNMTDDEIKHMEEKYACSTRPIITYSKKFEEDDEYLLKDDTIINDFSGFVDEE